MMTQLFCRAISRKTPLILFAFYFLPDAFVYGQSVAYITSFGTQLGTIIQTAIPVFIALAFLVFVWGLIVFIANSGNESEKESGRRKMIWGILAIFVIVSIWGILTIVRQLTGTTANAPLMPASWY